MPTRNSRNVVFGPGPQSLPNGPRMKPLPVKDEQQERAGTSTYPADDEEQDASEDTTETGFGLQFNTVKGYISGIQKLYEEQRSRGINPAGAPQGVTLKVLARNVLSTTWSRKRKEYMDRTVGTLNDVYSPTKLPKHTTATWSVSSPKSIYHVSVILLDCRTRQTVNKFLDLSGGLCPFSEEDWDRFSLIHRVFEPFNTLILFVYDRPTALAGGGISSHGYAPTV